MLLWGAAAAPQDKPLQISEIKAPTAALSQTPYLVSSQNKTYASWVEGESGKQSMRMSAWDGKSWSAPSTVVSGVPLFVNWADFPSIVPLENGALARNGFRKLVAERTRITCKLLSPPTLEKRGGRP